MKRILKLSLAVLLALPGGLRAQDLLPATLRITADPAATIVVNHGEGVRAETLTRTFPEGGTVLIKVSEPGYRTCYRTVPLAAGDRRHESFVLEPEPIPVLFRSAVEARVLCDGSELGVTPFHTFFTEPKSYRIVFRADGCQEAVMNLDLSNGRPRVVDQELLPDSGTIQLSSTPAGARVLVNGVARGVTPCTLARMREGEHEISLRADGYKRSDHRLRISAGETVPLAVTLERLPAGLTVSTIPAGARVYINDVYRGLSDLTLTDLSEGSYQVKIVSPGYATALRTVTVDAGTTHVEEFELVIVRGTLSVRTFPATARVLNGKKLIGKTQPGEANSVVSGPARFSLEPGDYTLTVEADGYESRKQQVTIRANQTTDLTVKLTFKPDFEIVTDNGTYRGVLIRQNEKGEVRLETKPGSYRTFLPTEIKSKSFLQK